MHSNDSNDTLQSLSLAPYLCVAGVFMETLICALQHNSASLINSYYKNT